MSAWIFEQVVTPMQVLFIASLSQEEARELLDSLDASTLVGLRDRALIATMIYTFGRVGAVIKMRVEDYYTQGRRGCVRLHEKGGKRHEMPCNHNLEAYLDAYINAAGLAGDLKGLPVPDCTRSWPSAHDESPRPGGRLSDDSSSGIQGGNQDQDRQSHIPGDGDYTVPAQRRPARARATDGGA
jgi:integrase